ncbi:hypothetical protein PSHT_14520 [Puccinia striiformis]|uniref:Secreted protein n=1 Tax=Puccinia striiformis TaxID=27350 RepID=A0A2S4UJU4_9BASI|nr:hypothetical protein H4Q26_000766 [Puccinia striiformis f. sp. tritici PST-130]POV97545.1 hypothetical protein PSHT_14520 [Puccinia striiformis]
MLPVLAVIALVAFPLGLLASSPQFCGLYFAPVPKDPAYHYCDNPGFKAYKCHTNTCGDVKSHIFEHCAPYLPSGAVGEGDVTVQFKAFFSFPQEGYLDAYESSGKKYRCSTDNAHPHNQLRPRCGSCDPRIY